MASKIKLKVLAYREALATLEDKTDNFLFVRNVAKPIGNLNFVVNDSSGARRTIVIKCDTFIPQDLTTQATKETLLLNPDFKNYYSKGALEIIDTDSAESAFRDNPKFRKEQEKLLGSLSNAEQDNLEKNITQVNAEPVVGNADDINPFVQNLLLTEEDTDVDEMIHLLDSRLDSLVLGDVEFIAATSKVAELRSWATDAKEVLGDDEED